MITKQIKITDSVKSYSTSIGRVGEYGVTKIEFDLSEWVELYGSGTAALTFIPPAGSEILINTTTSGNVLSWTIGTDATNKRGTGLARLRYSVTNGLKKSCEIYCEIAEGGTTNAQSDTSSYKSWIETAEELLESLEEYADDVDTIKENLSDKISSLQLDGNVLKGKDSEGNVKTSVTLPTNTGYQKPSTGIPESDLSEAVKTKLNATGSGVSEAMRSALYNFINAIAKNVGYDSNNGQALLNAFNSAWGTGGSTTPTVTVSQTGSTLTLSGFTATSVSQSGTTLTIS